jgi:hypothetical protein
MKKLSVAVLVLLLVNVVAYGQSGWTDDGTVVRLDDSTDYVGIGTTSPVAPLHILGNHVNQIGLMVLEGIDYQGTHNHAYLSLKAGAGRDAGIHIWEEDTKKWMINYDNYDNRFRFRNVALGYDVMALASDGNVGIGTTSPGEKLEVNGNLKISGKGYFVDSVGIGTDDPQSELAVNGTITAKEVVVTLDGWSDFVFSSDHNLMPLSNVEQHIKTNKSLPGIPTEKEVLENGVSLGEMQAKFLEKIEELTLYVIDLKKENVELKERMSILEKQ